MTFNPDSLWRGRGSLTLPDPSEGTIRELDQFSFVPHTMRFDLDEDQYKEQRTEKVERRPSDYLDLPSVISVLRNSWDSFQLFREPGGLPDPLFYYFPFLIDAEVGWKFYNFSKDETVEVVEILARGVSQMYHGVCGIMMLLDKAVDPTDLLLAKNVGPGWITIDYEYWDSFREGYSRLDEDNTFKRAIRLVKMESRPGRLSTKDGDIVHKPRHVSNYESGRIGYRLDHYTLEHDVAVFALSRSVADADLLSMMFNLYAYNILSQTSKFMVNWRWKAGQHKDVFGDDIGRTRTSAHKRIAVSCGVYEIHTHETTFNFFVRANSISLLGHVDDGDRGELVIGGS